MGNRWKAAETETGARHERCMVCGDEREMIEIPATGAADPAYRKPVTTARFYPFGLSCQSPDVLQSLG